MEAKSCVVTIFISAAIFFVFRVLYLLFKIHTSECELATEKSRRTVLCIGSGGHTTELLRIIQSLNVKYQPRLYILADNDHSSEARIHDMEKLARNYCLARIPRSRNVSQSLQSAIISTLYATLNTIPIIYKFKPDVIFCNGPGTCIPICVVAFLLRCLFILDCRTVFIESICRVRSMSMTGRILELFADLVIVQWPQLRDVCLRAKYYGRLV